MSATVIDARNLLCPMPVIRAQEGVAGLKPGDMVEVLCTDPGAAYDIPVWCKMWGHEMCNVDESEYEIVFTFRIGQQD